MAKASGGKCQSKAPARDRAPRPERGGEPSGLLDLQRKAGNQAVAKAMRPAHLDVQRVAVTGTFGETLYNRENATTGAATAGHFSGTTGYDITRDADGRGVTVAIKIRFLQQTRNTTPPPNPNPTNLPRLGQLVGSPSVIPAGDPSDRRTWATDTASRATTAWNARRITFVSQDHPQPGEGAGSRAAPLPPTPLRLPVTFRAEAVFGLADPAHQQVIVHPPGSVPGSPGHPIDAGNFYQQDPANRSAAYPHSDDVIYAHEYGHMLGIPDEYSQSNEQMNQLLHQASPTTAASSRAALDRASVERMSLAALSRPLYAQLQSALPAMVSALATKRSAVIRKLATAARTGVVSAEVRDALRAQLVAASDATRGAQVPTVVAFETTQNFSNLDIATQATTGAFALGGVQSLVGDAYWQALQAPHSTNVAVAGLDDVRINVSSGVYSSAGAGTAIAGNAAAEATSVVGPSSGGPGLPPVAPPASLIAQLSALPATWSAAGSALEGGVTPETFSTAMAAALQGAAAAAAAATAALPPGVTAPRLSTSFALYRRAYNLVDNSARTAARKVVDDLLRATVGPTLTSSVTALQAAIAAEVTRISTTPPTGLAAAGPADPQMAAVVAAMKARLDADKAATAGTGRDPTAGGGAVADQAVTYSAQGLMGSSNSTAVRTDQFQPMVDQFNTRLRRAPREDAFTVEVGR